MRMRLGILHDPEAQQRMHEREQRKAEEKKRKAETPTVRSEAEQKAYDEQKAKEGSGEGAVEKKEEEKAHRLKIRPLSEARAIELGANFFSEAFIFGVAVGLLLWENWRSRRKESARRDDVAERLEQLEAEVEGLRSKLDPDLETLHDLSERIKEAKRRRDSGSWWNPLSWVGPRAPEDTAIMEEEKDIGKPSTPQEEEHITPIRKAKAIAEKKDEPATAVEGKAAGTVHTDGSKKADQQDEKDKNSSDGKDKKAAPARVDSVTAGTKGR